MTSPEAVTANHPDDVIVCEGLVIFRGDALRRVLALVSIGIRHGQLSNALAPSPQSLRIQRALKSAASAASTDGRMDDHADIDRAVCESDTIDAAHAAQLLGLSRRSVYRLIRNGVLNGKKHCGTWVIEKDQIAGHLEERRNHARPHT